MCTSEIAPTCRAACTRLLVTSRAISDKTTKCFNDPPRVYAWNGGTRKTKLLSAPRYLLLLLSGRQIRTGSHSEQPNAGS